MSQKNGRTFLTRAISLVLCLGMALSLLVMPAGAAPEQTTTSKATLTVTGPTNADGAVTISMSEVNEAFTAVLTVPSSVAGSDAAAWAKNLTWTLSRTESGQDSSLYAYCYTGDELAKWQTWGTDGTDGTNYFELSAPQVTTTQDTVSVALPFKTANAFAVTSNGTNQFQVSGSVPQAFRNMPESFIGTYTLTVSSGNTALASFPVDFNMYQSYYKYSDIYQELVDIQKLAEKNGRYMNITVTGKSEGGFDQYYVTFSDSADSITKFQAMNAIAVTNPKSLIDSIEKGTMGEYRVPFFINNVHPDENPGVDAHLSVLRALATQDTITYNTLTGLKDGSDVDMKLFDEKVASIEGFTGLGSKKISGAAEGLADNASAKGNNDGKHDASEFYTISGDKQIKVDDLLDNLIILDCPNENPDGRTYNARRNGNAMDLNRDASNQTQAEPALLYPVVAQWNPVVFAELHGYMDEFLVEPCTPPHEPNLEYDLLVDNFVRGAEAFGCAALGSVSKQCDFDMKFQCYYTPLRDDYDPTTMTWSAWDDLCTNYGPSYAMLNCASLGYTIEIPNTNEASTALLEYGLYGLLDYTMQYKDDIYANQLQFFNRGINNIDARGEMDMWYVDVHNQPLAKDTWRVPYSGNNNYFPEYYVIPVDASAQRDPADAYEMATFLTNNDVDVRTLTRDVTVGGTTYKAGSLIVDMAQAKRNYANAVLWEGADASASGFPKLYSESVSNFPAMRGFDCIAVDTVGAFKGALSDVVTEFSGSSQLAGTGDLVILSNNGTETVRAINKMLADGVVVAMITEGANKGDFLVSKTTYDTYSTQFVLVGTAVAELPVAHQINQPKLFIAGRYDDYSNFKVTTGYYAQWFKDGYGYANWRNNQQNTTSSYDIVSYDKQMNFNLVKDPAEATVIVSDVNPSQGEKGAATVKAILNGTPYIATGYSPLSYIKTNLLPDMAYVADASGGVASLGQEALHYVNYPSDSIITASQKADNDNVIYTYNCSVISEAPKDAQILIKVSEKDSFIAGCALNTLGKNGSSLSMDGYVEAFAVERDGMDLTVFANSVNNRAHQQDDYTFVTNAIYSKCLAEKTITAAELANKFVDVPNNAYFAAPVMWAVENGITNGTNATHFSPDATCTRGQTVTFLWRAAGSPEVTSENPFTDVSKDAYYYNAVLWAVENGITNGTSATSFSPDATVTRGQVVTFQNRAAKAEAPATIDNPFTDVSKDAYYYNAVLWAVENEITNGTTATTFSPDNGCTRGQIVTFLYRAQ